MRTLDCKRFSKWLEDKYNITPADAGQLSDKIYQKYIVEFLRSK